MRCYVQGPSLEKGLDHLAKPAELGAFVCASPAPGALRPSQEETSSLAGEEVERSEDHRRDERSDNTT